MEVVVFIILFLISVGILCLKPFQKTKFGTLIVAGWFFKLTCAFLFVFVFTNYYSDGEIIQGDAYNFMNDSRILAEYGKKNPGNYFKLLVGLDANVDFAQEKTLVQTHIWSSGDNGDFINDNRLMIRLNSVIHFFSGGYIYTHALVMAFLSYLGLILLFKTFNSFVKNNRLFLVVLILFPSISFWGSGITKESILLFSLGLFIHALFHLFKRFSPFLLLQLLLGLLLLLINKPHVGLFIVSLSVFLVLGKLTHWKRSIVWFIPIITVLSSIILTYLPTQYNLLDKVSYKQQDLINIGKGGVFIVTDTSFCAFEFDQLQHFNVSPNGKKLRIKTKATGTYKIYGQYKFNPFEIRPDEKEYDVYLIQPPSNSYIPVEPINYDRVKLLSTLPSLFMTTLIRPYPWDNGSSLKYASFMNNLIFLFLLVLTLFNRRKLNSKEAIINSYLIVSALCILILIGWTTPILGAIVRYKVAVELILIISFFISLKSLKKTSK